MLIVASSCSDKLTVRSLQPVKRNRVQAEDLVLLLDWQIVNVVRDQLFYLPIGSGQEAYWPVRTEHKTLAPQSFSNREKCSRRSGKSRAERFTQPTTPLISLYRPASSSKNAVSSSDWSAWTATDPSISFARNCGMRSSGKRSCLRRDISSVIQPSRRESYRQKCWCESMFIEFQSHPTAR